MEDYEYDSDERYEDRGDGPYVSSENAFDNSEDADDEPEYVSEYAGIHRALFLLIIVLFIGIVLLGIFIAMRPAPVIVPTMKPPWLV
jgi:hypothetical protein